MFEMLHYELYILYSQSSCKVSPIFKIKILERTLAWENQWNSNAGFSSIIISVSMTYFLGSQFSQDWNKRVRLDAPISFRVILYDYVPFHVKKKKKKPWGTSREELFSNLKRCLPCILLNFGHLKTSTQNAFFGCLIYNMHRLSEPSLANLHY